MAKEIIKILGQVNPTLATETTLYTVPDGRQTVVSLLHAFVSGGANALIDVAIVPDGGNDTPPATAPKNYFLFQFPVATKQEAKAESTKGITLDEKDQIRVLSDVAGVAFHLYGVELEA